MADLKSSFSYTLIEPIKYGNKEGLEQEGSVLKIIAPSPNDIEYISNLKQEVMISQLDAMLKISKLDIKENRKEKILLDETELDKAKQIIILLIAGRAKMMVCYNCLELLLRGGTKEKPACLIEDSVKLTNPIWNQISIQDKENILGLYLANFIIPFLI